MPPKKVRFSTDRIVSISAILVSVGTLFVIVYQTNLISRAQRASVRPYVEIGLSVDNQEQKIRISNTGLGPAFIQEVRIITPDSIFVGDPSVFASRLFDLTQAFQSYSVDLLVPGRLIPASTSVIPMRHTGGPQQGFIWNTFKSPYNPKGQCVLEIIYESVYGDRWASRSDRYVPIAMD